jgi:hypothetical protein
MNKQILEDYRTKYNINAVIDLLCQKGPTVIDSFPAEINCINNSNIDVPVEANKICDMRTLTIYDGDFPISDNLTSFFKEELDILKRKIEAQLQSNALSATQVVNLTAAYNSLNNSVNELERYRSLSKDISLIMDDISDNLDFMTKSFLADVAYLTKGRSLLNDHKSAMNKLANIAKETLDIRLGEQAIDEKSLTTNEMALLGGLN